MSRAKAGGMIEVLIEVGAERARLAVRARSIPGALGVAEEHCPDGEARLVFPIDPERFFAGFGGRGALPDVLSWSPPRRRR